MKKPRTKRIHVNKHHIASNRIHGSNKTPYTCKVGSENLRGHSVALIDDAGAVVGMFVYKPQQPLKCGAVAWLETHLKTVVIDTTEDDELVQVAE